MDRNKRSLLNSFVCPQCGKRFPIYPRYSQRIKRGVISLFPDLRCSNCEAICRAVVDAKSAVWAWPVTLQDLDFG